MTGGTIYRSELDVDSRNWTSPWGGRLLVVFALMILIRPVEAGDWPLWRYDAGHTAFAPDDLPTKLSLDWQRVYSKRIQVWDDPLNNDLMQYDRIFEPVVKDGRMFITFNDRDQVVALDVESGETLWTVFTDSPVRFPAAAWRDAVFFSSDDGYLYAVDAETGTVRWKFRGGPAAQKVIGNQRVISAWPARGAPVVDDQHVYFAASIWPFMGTFIYCLDAETGDVVWVNDSSSADYIKQPHSAPAFAGVAPQGVMGVTGDYLLIPGGRSVPAALDRHTGQIKHFKLNEGGKGNGGSLVLADDDEFYVHTRDRGVRAFDLESGDKTAFMTNEPVLHGGLVIAAETVASDNDEIPVVRVYDADKQVVVEVKGVDGSGDVIQVGSVVYAAGGGKITAVSLDVAAKTGQVDWQIDAPVDIQRLLAAHDRLFAVTLDGSILCFSGHPGESRVLRDERHQLQPSPLTPLAETILQATEDRYGYLFAFGPLDTNTIDALLSNTKFELVVVDDQPAVVDALRRHYDRMGLYGNRISVHVGTVNSYQAPPYVGRVVVLSSELANSEPEIQRAYETVRPYGGKLIVAEFPKGADVTASPTALSKLADSIKSIELEKAEISVQDDAIVASRVGALPGAADWNHQYGNVANTVKSNDSRVRLPLGVLWFGGSSNLDALPRHGHGPPEQVVNGRLYIEGMNSLSCRDVYTGQILWKRTFDDLGTYDIYYDETYRDTPLDPAYNQVHIPGANGRGTNFVAMSDFVYLVEGDHCQVLDAETGETTQLIFLPEAARSEGREWAYIGVYEDLLLAGSGFANYRERQSVSFREVDSLLSGNAKGFGSKSLDVAATLELVAYDRHTGEVRWSQKAEHSFLHNGIVAGNGRIYCLDKLPEPVENKLRRRGIDAPATYRIVSFDAQSGQVLWEQRGDIFGTWLGYSAERDLLLHAGAAASDRLKIEVGQGMAVYQGSTGDVVWKVDKRAYSGPCILHNDTILTNANSYSLSAGAFSLLDGSPTLIQNPLTKEEQPWQLCRTYGCNTIVASENLLTFRSGAAGFYDLQTLSGTGNLGGFKSGCTSNLIVANGVLNAPDYTRTCSCSYQNQTSLALVHMPAMDMWTVNHVASLAKPGEQIKRIGVNFGAPGDRMSSEGTLWIDYPVVGGESVELDIRVDDDANYYRRNSFHFEGGEDSWIGASGVEGATKLTIPMFVRGVSNGRQFQLTQSADDAEEAADGSVSLDSSDLEFVTDADTQVVGIRFESVDLKPQDDIKSAYLQFTVDETTKEDTHVSIAIEDNVKSAPFQDQSHNISSRTTFTDTVEWTIPPWSKQDEAGESQRSPDLAPLLQHLIQRSDWEPGSPISFIISGRGKRVAKAVDRGAAGAATLIVKDANAGSGELAASAHRVRLVFAEPDEAMAPGSRVFDILLNGQLVEENFDVTKSAGGTRTIVTREYPDVPITDQLLIELRPKQGKPILAGVEIIGAE